MRDIAHGHAFDSVVLFLVYLCCASWAVFGASRYGLWRFSCRALVPRRNECEPSDSAKKYDTAGTNWENMNVRTYPVSLVLEGKRCLVVGGGRVALRKSESLKDAGAVVTVISPAICDELADLDGVDKIVRPFAVTDLDGVFLVIGATDSREVNRLVANESARRGILCNIVDDPPLCNFYVNSSVSRGDLNIAISTGGVLPALSKHIRQELEKVYGPEYEVLVRLLGEYRDKLREQVADISVRAAVMTRLVNAGIETVIKDHGETEARRKIKEIIAEETSP